MIIFNSFAIISPIRTSLHVWHRSGNGQGKVSENFTFSLSQGNLSLWKKSGKSEILRVRIYYFSRLLLLFSNIQNYFVHFTVMNHVTLVEYDRSRNWTKSWFWIFKKTNPFGTLCLKGSTGVISCTLNVTCWKHKNMGGEGSCEGRVESIIRIDLLNCFKLSW